MAGSIRTVFQNLEKTLGGGWGDGKSRNVSSYDFSNAKNTVIYKTNDKEDYEKKKLELRQQNYLNNIWRTSNRNLNNNSINGLNAVKMMYRDVEIMSCYPEIGAALDLYADESTVNDQKGNVINVYSDSTRIKSIIEDLLVNRLDIQTTAPMIIRALCKYGNQFMLLNIKANQGICGWRQLPPSEIERVEDGILVPYAAGYTSQNNENEGTTFVWMGNQTGNQVFRNWQIAHFRLLEDSIFLPYGCSILHKARRHFRLLSLMEDSMLLYRLERSVERRVYKIYVGAIDDADVQGYVEDIANSIKRTPIVDPQTGQLDLRKNILAVDQDIFIPTRNEDSPTPIDTLPAGQNLTAIDDIKYIQNKVLAGLRIPKAFLNFEEATGDGKNLALMDVRFARVITRIQQAFLMELTKVVTIHLYLLGFKDDLTNFTLTMNNPSTQAEQLEIENLAKKIAAVRDAVSDPGNGIPVMSMTRAWKEIMKYNDAEIKDMLEEIRLEKALAAELEKTSQIIKRTNIFDTVDKIYGEPGAEYQEDNAGGMPGADGGLAGGGGGGASIGGGGFGDGLDNLGDPGNTDNSGDISGEEGSTDTNNIPGETNNSNQTNPQESKLKKNKPLIIENNLFNSICFNKMMDKINHKKDLNETAYKRVEPSNESRLLINEEYDSMIDELNKIIDKHQNNNNE